MKRLPEYVAYEKTKGIPIEELPEEYEQYKTQIEELRKYEQIRIENDLMKKNERKCWETGKK